MALNINSVIPALTIDSSLIPFAISHKIDLETAPSALYLYTTTKPFPDYEKHFSTPQLSATYTGRKIALSAGLRKKKKKFNMGNVLKTNKLSRNI